MKNCEVIALYQPLLHSIALRIVGSIQDAEDIVQDTFEKWLSVDASNITNTKAYLIRSVSNNSFKFLNTWNNKSFFRSDNEPGLTIADEQQESSMFHFDMENQMSQAWTVLHRKLEPIEKSIFVMREAFNMEYEELQLVYDKKIDNLRKIFSRARQKVRDEVSRLNCELPKSAIPSSFIEACTTGHLSEIMSDLRNEMRDMLPAKKK